MDTPQPKPMPKRTCIISVMFGIDNDEQALRIKQKVDEAVSDIKEKRYNFQITES